MNTKIQTVHFVPATNLIELVKRKIGRLSNFESRITDVCVFLKLDNMAHHIKDKVVEIRVHIPRYDFFVKATSKNFEHSVGDAFASITKYMKRKKDRELTTN
ncbi:MAG: HPF/RaiA family ribosome-associated protein [Bacteroidetes bacterium]|nr:HPF/RaiA family ribosome-associated protein [Bacteroidota bacterium]